MNKLHLGCGDKHIDGFINIDGRDLPTVDKVDNVTTLLNFKDNSIELIYACHVLEHVGRNEYLYVLKRWYDLLQSNGILRIAVPDIEQVCAHYTKFKDLKLLRGLLWGGQTHPLNYHYVGWDFDTLKDDLIEVGFKDISRYDWTKTEHAHIDDYSQCFLPHMDKENGMLMSLNVEATK